MRTWVANLAGMPAASFPADVLTPWLDGQWYEDHPGFYTDNTLNGGAPGSAVVPSGSPYKLTLEFRPKELTIGITLDGAPTSLLQWGTVPSASGQIALNYISGEISFHSSDTGKAVVATYEALGTVVDPYTLNRLISELAATQTYAAALGAPVDVLATVTGLQLVGASTPLLFTTTAPCTVTGAYIVATTSNVTGYPTVSIGSVANSYDNIIGSIDLSGLTAAGKCAPAPTSGTIDLVASGTGIHLNNPGATGTSLIVSIKITGFYW